MKKQLTESELKNHIYEIVKSMLSEKAKSKAQQHFMGMVRAVQTGEMEPEDASPEVNKAATTMKKKDVKDMASTRHKGLPNHEKRKD